MREWEVWRIELLSPEEREEICGTLAEGIQINSKSIIQEGGDGDAEV